MNNQLTLLCGLPRSGKSTWTEKNKGDNIVVSSDWIREHILGESYSYCTSSKATIWMIMDATLRIVLGQGKNVIIDGVNQSPDVRKFYLNIAKEYGAKTKIVVFKTPLEICLKRNRSKKGHKLPEKDLIAISKSIKIPEKEECDEIIFV